MKKFELGRVVVTQEIHHTMSTDADFATFVHESLGRYATLDWGDTCADDRLTNDRAVEEGERVLAVYNYSDKSRTIWIITEWDRSVTTILFPHEY